MVRGSDLVVTAIWEGREAASGIFGLSSGVTPALGAVWPEQAAPVNETAPRFLTP